VRKKSLSPLLLLALLLPVAGCLLPSEGCASRLSQRLPIEINKPEPPQLSSLPFAEKDMVGEERRSIEVYRRVSPAVVHIKTSSLSLNRYMEPTPRSGDGSGVIIATSGIVVTNFHVIKDADAVEVVVPGFTESFSATFIGADPNNDIALIKIVPAKQTPAPSFPFVSFGPSDKLVVGQYVYAIGNPFGFEGSLSQGIVSSLGRQLPTHSGRIVQNVIQTDAAINPGNSGGALLDSQGRLIGINTAIYGPGGSIGIGFAIPSNTVQRITDDLLKYGRVKRAWLGVDVQVELSPWAAKLLHLPVNKGVLVAQVDPQSPAAKAGLQGGKQMAIVGRESILLGGDIITRFNDQPIEQANHLMGLVELSRPGEKIKLTVWRPGAGERTIPVVLGEAK
jgi:S1-C subfamily serine protease